MNQTKIHGPYLTKKMRMFWVLLIIAACVLILPSFLNALASRQQLGSMSDYNSMVNGMTQAEIKAEKKKVRAYNKDIYEYQMQHGFYYQGQNVTDARYESLLSSKDDAGGNIMGYLEIPTIDVYLPIGHGTSNQLLQYASGHMYGSSLPLGGKNTNAILAGHTGLSTARLFTDVKTMKKGDEIHIHVLDEIHRYKLIRMDEVPQGDAETAYLQMNKGKDEVTLYTCSPYGVNDHRIILRLKRAYPDIPFNQGNSDADLNGLSKDAIIKMILLLCVPGSIFACSQIHRMKEKKKLGVNEISG